MDVFPLSLPYKREDTSIKTNQADDDEREAIKEYEGGPDRKSKRRSEYNWCSTNLCFWWVPKDSQTAECEKCTAENAKTAKLAAHEEWAKEAAKKKANVAAPPWCKAAAALPTEESSSGSETPSPCTPPDGAAPKNKPPKVIRKNQT